MQSNNSIVSPPKRPLRTILLSMVIGMLVLLGVHEYLNFREYFAVRQLQAQADSMEQIRDYAGMLKVGQRCQSDHPNSGAGFFISGKAHYYRRELTSAISDLQMADRLSPEYHTTFEQWIRQVQLENGG